MYQNLLESLCVSLQTVREMLSDRGISTPNLDAITNDELTTLAKTAPVFKLDVNDDIVLIYYTSTKFKINDMRKFVVNGKHNIAVFREKINNLNEKNLRESVGHLEIFLLRELTFNISKHSYVPKHELIRDQDEIRKIMEKYSIKHRNQLPVILHNDPMARYLELRVGDLVRITRTSPSAGVAYVYRVCI